MQRAQITACTCIGVPRTRHITPISATHASRRSSRIAASSYDLLAMGSGSQSARTARRVAAGDRERQAAAQKRKKQAQTEYEAQEILEAIRKEDGTFLYKVRWAAPWDDPRHDTLEPAQNLSAGLLREYGGAEGQLPNEEDMAQWRRTDRLVGRRPVDPSERNHVFYSFVRSASAQGRKKARGNDQRRGAENVHETTGQQHPDSSCPPRAVVGRGNTPLDPTEAEAVADPRSDNLAGQPPAASRGDAMPEAVAAVDSVADKDTCADGDIARPDHGELSAKSIGTTPVEDGWQRKKLLMIQESVSAHVASVLFLAPLSLAGVVVLSPPPPLHCAHPREEFRCSVNTMMLRKLNGAIAAVADAVARATSESREVDWSRERDAVVLYSELTKKTQQLHSIERLHLLPRHPKTLTPLYLRGDGNWECGVCKQSGGGRWPWQKKKLMEHLVSRRHLDMLRAQLHSTSLAGAARAGGAAAVEARNLVSVFKDASAIVAAHGTMSFKNGSACLRFAQQLVTNITGGYNIGPSDLKHTLGTPLHPILTRLQAVSSPIGTAGPLLLDRTNVSRRSNRVGEHVVEMKADFFMTCENSLWMIVDETTTRNSGSKPAYVALCGTNLQFEYLLSFVGQADTSSASGEELLQLLWDVAKRGGATATSLAGVTTDGCHSMRSDRAHAGIVPWEGSKSFVTRLKKQLDNNLLAVACAAHNLNLALGDAVKEHVPPYFMAHLRLLASEFSRSAKRKAELQDIYTRSAAVLDQLADIDDEIAKAPALLFPKRYCPTRWSGILICCESILRCVVPLQVMTTELSTAGFGPSLSDSFGNEEEVLKWQEDVEKLRDLKPNRHGLAEDFPESKRSNLLNYWTGVNPENWLLVSAVTGVLRVYQTLITRLQTTLQPVGHKVRRWVEEFSSSLETQFIQEGVIYTGPYFKARSHFLEAGSAQENRELVQHTDTLVRRLAKGLLDNTLSRLDPYMAFYGCLELTDPLAATPDGHSGVWEQLHQLCQWWDVDEAELRSDIVALKTQAAALPDREARLSQDNLLEFYRANHDRPPLAGLPHLLRFARHALSVPIASAFVESLFSVMASTKTQRRSSLHDDTVAACMHLRSVEDPTADSSTPIASADGKLKMTLQFCRHQEHRLGS